MVVERLAAKGAALAYHDPFVPALTVGDEELRSVELAPEVIAAFDVVVILTPHPGIDVRGLVNVARLVFARGTTNGLDAPNVVRL